MLIGLNKKFHQYQNIVIDSQDKAFISSVEGKVVYIGNIDNDGMLISNHNKKIQLKELIGDNCQQFIGGKY